MKSTPIRIIDMNFNLLGEVDSYTSLMVKRSWHGLGEVQLVINRHSQNADKLLRGNIIFPYNQLNKAYIIKYREFSLDEDGKASEDIVIKAMDLKSWLSQRITIPPLDKAYDNKKSNAESVMLHYVNNNVINPINADRKMDNIMIADNENRGDTIEWQSRYKVLSEELEKIGLQSGLGWNIDLDIVNKKFIFKVLEGNNRVAGQYDLPPAIFSPEFGTLAGMNYLESELDYKNHAIVAGQGEGVDRRIVEVESNKSGFDRYELFVDARDVAEETEDDPPQPIPVEQIEEKLIVRGNQKLQEHEQEIFMEGQALSNNTLKYERDFNLGDMVTIQNKDWGVTMDSRITEVTEIYEESGFKLDVVFGNDRPTLLDIIKDNSNKIDLEITR